MSEKIAVVGAGSWGTAVANILADQKHSVALWGRDETVCDQINKNHENNKYLKGIKLNPHLKASTDLERTLSAATFIVNSIPTQQIRNVYTPFTKQLGNNPILNTSKGIEIGTQFRVSQIFKELSTHSPYAVLSGPSFAEEVVKRLPAAVTIASLDEPLAKKAQALIATKYFRAYRSKDVVGVELAGALKNIVAIASGVVTGLKLGYNATAAIITRGLAEMARLGRAQKASPMTFLGLSGMGDLVLTCTGPLSRNRKLGVALGEGMTLEKAKASLGGVAEGYYTSQSACALAEKLKVELPIAEQVQLILTGAATPEQAWDELMNRDLKEE